MLFSIISTWDIADHGMHAVVWRHLLIFICIHQVEQELTIVKLKAHQIYNRRRPCQHPLGQQSLYTMESPTQLHVISMIALYAPVKLRRVVAGPEKKSHLYILLRTHALF